MKTRSDLDHAPRASRAAAQHEAHRRAETGSPASPREAAQRKRLEAGFGVPLQRAQDGEEPIQGRFSTAQRAGDEADEEPLQGRFSTAQRAAPEEDEELQRKPDPAAENSTGLPDALKAGVESLSGMSLDGAKVHYNSSRPAQLNALAFAQGSEIHVGPGQEQHLPHEAWHLVQQADGRVQPTRQLKGGVAVNDDVALEAEADTMGARAVASGMAALQRAEVQGTLRLSPGAAAQRACAACEQLEGEPVQRVAVPTVVQRIDVPGCEALWRAYKDLGRPQKCKPGDAPAERRQKTELLDQIINGRSAYLAQDCDAVLPGSIARGTEVARSGHQTQVDQIKNMRAKCG